MKEKKQWEQKKYNDNQDIPPAKKKEKKRVRKSKIKTKCERNKDKQYEGITNKISHFNLSNDNKKYFYSCVHPGKWSSTLMSPTLWWCPLSCTLNEWEVYMVMLPAYKRTSPSSLSFHFSFFILVNSHVTTMEDNRPLALGESVYISSFNVEVWGS